MRFAVDSSVLVRLYLDVEAAENIERFLAEDAKVVSVSELARRFARTLRPGGHDLVLVAAAVAMGATWFLSSDRNSRQRPLAAAAGLRVWPPLDKAEKGLVRHTTQRAEG
jgi:hypothetical protein